MQTESQRRWYVDNRERLLEKKKKYYYEHQAECINYSSYWNRANPDKRREIVRESSKRNKSKWMPAILGRNAVSRAIREGIIERPRRCTVCGKEEKPEAHHHKGYDKEHRFDVVWLCKKCHASAHRKP